MARDSVAKIKELPQEVPLCPAKQRHVGAILRPAEHGAEGDHQNLMQIVTGVVVARVLQLRETRHKPLHGTPKRLNPRVRIYPTPRRNPSPETLKVKCDSPAGGTLAC